MTNWDDLQTPGTLINDRYRVERVLGTGGMGIVIGATHIDAGHKVAIKILRKELLASEEVVARFMREAQAAVKLRGPNVGTVLDVSRLADGAPFIVMEFLTGRDLEQVLEARGPLPISEVVDYVIQACAGLAEAHRNDIVHRDIKPANLFLTTRPDGSSLVKVLDFGIAKLRSAELHALTGTGQMMGTPYYMAPEQLRSTKSVDARADVWSLGATIYHLITGRVPFPGDTLADVTLRVWSAEPDPLPASVPEAFGPVLRSCFAKDPEDRMRDVARLAEALAPFGSASAKVAAERVGRILRGVGAEERVGRPAIVPLPANAATLAVSISAKSNVARQPSRRGVLFAATFIPLVAICMTIVLIECRAANPVEPERPTATGAPAPPPPVDPPADPLEAQNPFVEIHGVHVQAHEVTAREYGATQVRLDEPVAWVTHAQAAAFCARHRSRLPTGPEWERAAAGSWAITNAGVTGPLQEWTADLRNGKAIARGGFRGPPATEIALEPDAVPNNPSAAARNTIGFRCARD